MNTFVTDFEPIVAMLRNTATNRWHPVLFREAPLSGPSELGKPVRYKLCGQHTAGFDTREAAVNNVNELCEAFKNDGNVDGTCKLALAEDIPWDGQEEIPAVVAFFADLPDGTAKRLF